MSTSPPTEKNTETEATEESPKGSLFTFRTDVVKTSWHREILEEYREIQIAIEQPNNPYGTIVCDHISPHLLFSLAPGLQKDLFDRKSSFPRRLLLMMRLSTMW
jgi:hypothetical protein